MSNTKAIPETEGQRIIDFLEQATGRQIEYSEISEELQRVWRIARAATNNADKVRRQSQTRIYSEDISKARKRVAESMGRMDLLESIYRNDIGEVSVNLVRPEGSTVNRGSMQREVFTRAMVSPVSTSDGVQPEQFDYSKLNGVVGTPFGGGTPAVELNSDLYPYRGRGLSYDQGQFMAAYRSDSVIREGVSNLVSVIAGASIEVSAPSINQKQAELIGINRDYLDTVCEAINIDLHFGKIDFSDAFEQLLRSGIINGFGMYEFAMNPYGRIGERITGLSPRLPNTVMRWIFDNLSGDLIGVQQTNPNGSVYQSGLAPFLDIRKTVLFSVDRDGDNFEGLSLVRSARAWDLLAMEVTSSSILHWQRFGPGVPVIRRNSSAPNSSAASDAAFAALSKYANLADAVLELGDGIEVELLQMQMNTGLEGIIDMCAKYKRSAIRDAVSGLGTESAGAYNLGDVKSQLWLKGLSVFARQIERAWQNMIRVYCDIFYPGMVIYPQLKVSGFATRSATEVINLQNNFSTLVQSGQYTDRELVEIAEKAEIIWHGRGKEGEISDIQTNAISDNNEIATPQVSTEESLETEISRSEDTGIVAPPEARRNSAIGLRKKRNTDSENRWNPSVADAVLVKKIAGGESLSQLDLRMIEAYFAGCENIIDSPEWNTQGPVWQEFYSFGGWEMAEWLDEVLNESNEDTYSEPEYSESNTIARAKKYDHIDFTPPKGVREAAKRGLEVRASKPPSQRGGTPVGIARARDLSNGKKISPDTARRMKAYFDRHEVDKKGSTWDEQGAGWQAWMLWGGDPGYSWSKKLVKQMNAADENASRDNVIYRSNIDHTYDCKCGRCSINIASTRARQNLFEVETRTGTFATWRNLTPAEQSVSFERIASAKERAVSEMIDAINREQNIHRDMWIQASQYPISNRDVLAISDLDINHISRYRAAIVPILQELSDFANKDMLEEISSQIGSKTWIANSETISGSAAQVEAAASMAARAVNDRVNEQLRGAALQVANGAKSSTLRTAALSVGNAASGLLEQAASTTVNETRANTAAEQGPKIEKAVYSAVMDRLTCEVCAKADGTEVDYGTQKYIDMTPPNPRCKSVQNSGGVRNLCQCVWIYEYVDSIPSPGPINSTPSGGLIVRESKSRNINLNLVIGPPGIGKSSWAIKQDGIVIDRDEYVFGDNGEYDYSGRQESLDDLVDTIKVSEPGVTIHFVACMLTEKSRNNVIEYVSSRIEDELFVTVTAFDFSLESVIAVNTERSNESRGSIPEEQLMHMINAYEPPDTASGNVTFISLD